MVELMAKSCHRKGQGSLEYLLVIAVTFLIIVPTAYLFYNYSRQTNKELEDSQIIKLGNNIIDAAASIYYSGEDSKTTVELTMPENVFETQIVDGRELVMKVHSEVGDSDLIFFTPGTIKFTTNVHCVAGECTVVPTIKKGDPDADMDKLGSPGFKKVKLEAKREKGSTNLVIAMTVNPQ